MSYRFSSGYLITDATGLPRAESAKSLFCRINLDSAATLQTFLNFVDATAGIGYQLGVRNSALTLWNYGGTAVVSVAAVNAQVWMSVGYTYDGTTSILYADGAVVASSSAVAVQTGAPTASQLGGNQWAENTAGLLEDLRVFSKALTPAEMMTLHCGANIVDGLVAHWPLNDVVRTISSSNPKELVRNKQHTLSGTAPIAQDSYFNRIGGNQL